MSALFLELARTVLFFSSSPLAFKMRMISSMEFLPPHGEVEKALPVVMLLVSVDDVVGLELLVTTLADKHLATVLQKGNKLLLSLGQILMQTILAAIFSESFSGR